MRMNIDANFARILDRPSLVRIRIESKLTGPSSKLRGRSNISLELHPLQANCNSKVAGLWRFWFRPFVAEIAFLGESPPCFSVIQRVRYGLTRVHHSKSEGHSERAIRVRTG